MCPPSVLMFHISSIVHLIFEAVDQRSDVTLSDPSQCSSSARVDLHVSFQVGVQSEAFPADLAGVRPLSRVDPHVHLTVPVAAEAFPTEAAGEGPLSGVAPDVDHQAVPGGVALVADGAAVLQFVGGGAPDRVDPHVHQQLSVLRERLPADQTGEKAPGRVGPGGTGRHGVVAVRVRVAAVAVLRQDSHHDGVGLLLQLQVVVQLAGAELLLLLFDLERFRRRMVHADL